MPNPVLKMRKKPLSARKPEWTTLYQPWLDKSGRNLAERYMPVHPWPDCSVNPVNRVCYATNNGNGPGPTASSLSHVFVVCACIRLISHAHPLPPTGPVSSVLLFLLCCLLPFLWCHLLLFFSSSIIVSYPALFQHLLYLCHRPVWIQYPYASYFGTDYKLVQVCQFCFQHKKEICKLIYSVSLTLKCHISLKVGNY